jgi:two-component system chemotaxis sensor kinase CheA
MKRPDSKPSAAPTGTLKIERDAETVELFGDFVAESEDGLGRVDEILLEAQRASILDERVNELFRVFHTIKGVSGFLEAVDVTHLAHATETLLDGARSHKYPLDGRVLDAVFEASAAMRRLLGEVRLAVEAGRAIGHDEALPLVIYEIEHATDPADAALPQAGVSVPVRAEVAVTKPAAPPPKLSVPEPAASILPPRTVSAGPAALPRTVSVKPRASKKPRAAKVSLAAPPPEPPAPPAPEPPREAPEAAPAPANAEGGGAVRLRETVKVDLERIDSVVEMIGELLIVESMVVGAPEVAALSSSRVHNYLGQLSKISRDLQGVAMRMRMIPVRGVFHRMARLTRDLARKTGKSVELVQTGEATEMDRSMVERIEDPLVHMIRNAIDHAIEPAAERESQGKPEKATIQLSAQHEAGSITIEISDDGRGLRREKILAKARERGLVSESSDHLSDDEVFALIFLPGFSTAPQVSELSGRGVGMDVVKRSIEAMRGRVLVRSKPGVGTTFKLVLPLTLAIIDGMLVSCGDETYIIPSLAIVESLQVTPGLLCTVAQKGELLNVRDEVLPLLRLRRLIGKQGAGPATEQCHIVVVESLGKKVGLLVDEVLTQAQIVIKPLVPSLGDTELFAGAAILADGRVGLILNVDRLGDAPPSVRPRTLEQRGVSA